MAYTRKNVIISVSKKNRQYKRQALLRIHVLTISLLETPHPFFLTEGFHSLVDTTI